MRFLSSKKTPLLYQMLVPPLPRPINQLTPEEAKAFFEWYVAAIPERIEYLASHCLKKCPEQRRKPESLITVWRWFLKNATFQVDEQGKDWILSIISEYILRDIGMYLGEVIIANNPGFSWSYYTLEESADVFVNAPYIKGFVYPETEFQMVFDPIHMARIQALKLLPPVERPAKARDLYDLYLQYMQYVPIKKDNDD